MIKKFTATALSILMMFLIVGCTNDDTAEESGNVLAGNNWESTSGMLLSLKEDDTFYFFKSSDEKDDNYYFGDYSVLSGQEAVDYLEENHMLPEESQLSAISSFNVDLNHYYALVLNNTACVEGGVNTLTAANQVAYYGYYTPEYKYLKLYNLKTMNSYEFYKK